MKELWDGYRQDGALAGVTLVRGEPIPPGLYHLVADILVRHRDGHYLLMQRSFEKPRFGGWFEATAGGSALAGEDSLSCARRELEEETGIFCDVLRLIGRSWSRDTIYDNYLCITDQDKETVRPQPGETISYKWVTEGAFIDFIHSGSMIDTQKQRWVPFFQKMGYME